MGSINLAASSPNLAWIIPACIVAGMLLAAIEWGAREVRAAARGVYPDSPEHRQALATVNERTAPCCTWQDLTTAEQAAWDEASLDRAAAALPPLPPVKGGDTP